MIRVLRFLWTGDWHLHKWKIVEKTRCESSGAAWTRRHGQCEVCETIKVFDE